MERDREIPLCKISRYVKRSFYACFLYMLLIVLGLWIDAYGASLMKKAVIAKGYGENN